MKKRTKVTIKIKKELLDKIEKLGNVEEIINEALEKHFKEEK